MRRKSKLNWLCNSKTQAGDGGGCPRTPGSEVRGRTVRRGLQASKITLKALQQKKENKMAKKEVERFLINGGEDKVFRLKYDEMEPKPAFIAEANKDGFDFTEDEFDAVLRESGDSYESYGNPRKRSIWWM
jgi:hypothetical protein